MMWRAAILGLAGATAAAGAADAARVLFAGGSWAAIDRGRRCEAAAKALRPAKRGEEPARAAFLFDRARKGELAVRLSRPVRPGSTVLLTVGEQPFLLLSRGAFAWSRGPAQEAAIIAAVREARGMRIEAREPGGRRFVDRYLLAGASTAIDAAAAGCAG